MTLAIAAPNRPARVRPGLEDTSVLPFTQASVSAEHFLVQRADNLAQQAIEIDPVAEREFVQYRLDTASVRAKSFFRDFLAKTIGEIPENPGLAELLTRYYQEKNTLDFSQDQALIDALSQVADLGDLEPGSPSQATILSQFLLRALTADIGLYNRLADFNFSSVRGNPPEQASEQIAIMIKNALPVSLRQQLDMATDDDTDTPDLSHLLARQLAPVLLPEPTLYLAGEMPYDMYYGDRLWGDLSVGVKVASDAAISLDTLSPRQLIELGQKALQAEAAQTTQDAPGAMTLKAYKALTMASAQGYIDMRKFEDGTLDAAGIERALEQFINVEYQNELQATRALAELAELGEIPDRTHVARKILLEAGIQPDKKIVARGNSASTFGGVQYITQLEEYMSRRLFSSLPDLPDINVEFDRAFKTYQDRSATAIGDLLIAQTRRTLRNLSIPLAKTQFEVREPKVKSFILDYSNQIVHENKKIPPYEDFKGTFSGQPLVYIVKATTEGQSSPRYFLFSPEHAFSVNEPAPGLEILPASVDSDASLNQWLGQRANLRRLFGPEVENTVNQHKKEAFPWATYSHILRGESTLAGGISGRLEDVAAAAGQLQAAVIGKQYDSAYQPTPVEQLQTGVRDFFTGLIPFYDAIQAAKNGDTNMAVTNALLDVLGFIPTLGSGAKLASRAIKAGIAAAGSFARGLTSGTVKLAAQTLAASLRNSLPQLAQAGRKFAHHLMDDLLPFGGLAGLNTSTLRLAQVAETVTDTHLAQEIRKATARAENRLGTMYLTDTDTIGQLDRAMRQFPEQTFQLDANGDKYIRLADNWYRFRPDRNNANAGIIMAAAPNRQSWQIRIGRMDNQWQIAGGPLPGGMRKRLLATLTFDQTMFGPPSGQNMTERARAMLPEQVDAVLGQIRTLPEPSFALDTSSAGYRAFESLGGFGDAPVGTRRAYKENGFIHVKKRLGFDSSTFIGDKLHISVDRTQLEQAYDACAPLLLSKDSPVDYFKIRDRLYAEGRSGRTMDDLQFTLYFKPAGADKTYTAEQIKSVRAFTAQLEDRLKQAGIRPTNIDQSDVKLASSDYISYRHEFNSERETAADFARVSREPFFRLITENPSAGNRELASRTGLNV